MGHNKRQHQRTVVIHLDPRNCFEFEGLKFDFNTQKLMGVKGGESHPLLGESRLEYKKSRSNKEPKVLHASISPTNDTWFSANHQLLTYDHLIAVDTNTHQICGSSVSITAAYHIIPGLGDSKGVHCRATTLALVEFWNISHKPENHGWWQILAAVAEHPASFAGKIGLIVDSDLGSHPVFNRREAPIFGDFFLPDNVSLIHASDKGAPELLATKMIRHCHNLATDLYCSENLLLRTDGLYPGLEPFYSHIRQWDTEASDVRPIW